MSILTANNFTEPLFCPEPPVSETNVIENIVSYVNPELTLALKSCSIHYFLHKSRHFSVYCSPTDCHLLSTALCGAPQLTEILASCNTCVRNGPDLNVSTMKMRCATKHQELEQHIGNLTALMELKSGQDEQARRQKEQQTKLIDVLRGLTEVQGK